MSSYARLRRARGALLVACAALSACGGDAVSTGEPDALVVAAHPDLWPRIEARLKAKLEPSLISTTGKAFEVTYQDPTKPEWGEQRRARQLLLIGTPADPWMDEALSKVEKAPPTAPALLEVEDVWAKPQQVTLLTLPEGDARAAVTAKLDSLRAGLEERYRAWVVGEMFASGANQALSDSLLEQSWFTVLVPRDYETSHDGDVYSFRKEDDSAQVIRQVAVTWRTPIPAGLQGEGLLAWRRDVAAAAYGVPQSVALANVDATQTTHRGNVAYQLLGTWRNPTRSGPTRGRFIMRAVFCPTQDRVYLVDGWLFAPDQDQHRYLVELESIVNSFRCGSARSSQPNE
ncbi:MAG: DUF4837 family protein [Gemmatimonadetes bacterium]|nr:DUF4837 family protein [Gemmatimonadota bacterium]